VKMPKNRKQRKNGSNVIKRGGYLLKRRKRAKKGGKKFSHGSVPA